MLPAREALDRLAPSPEEDVGSLCDLAYRGEGHVDGRGHRVHYLLGGADQELVVLASRRGEDAGVAPERPGDAPRVLRNGQQIKIYRAPDPAPLADPARVRGEPV